MRELAVVIQNENGPVNVIETINSIKNAGFKNVFIQWYDDEKWEISQKEQLELCQKLNLNIIFAHLGYQKINSIWFDGEEGESVVERYKNDIRTCAENGISLVIMHLVSNKNAPMYNEIGLNRFKQITDYARELGVRVAFENTKLKGYLEYILGNITDEHVGLCFDAGHFHVHFDDIFDFDFFKNRIFAVHLHDNDKSDDQHLLPFDGTIDWKYVIKKLKDANYNGPITLELCYRRGYNKMTLDDFYKIGYERGIKLAEIMEEV